MSATWLSMRKGLDVVISALLSAQTQARIPTTSA
jgi:hypothetical protein